MRLAQVVGEAASRVDNVFRQSHPEIPWREAAALRHRLVHDYIEINFEVLVETIRHDFPPLVAAAEKILDEAAGTSEVIE